MKKYIYYVGANKLCESASKCTFSEHFPSIREEIVESGVKAPHKVKEADGEESVYKVKEDK